MSNLKIHLKQIDIIDSTHKNPHVKVGVYLVKTNDR
jgi:hypothetical protein